jgi:GT2 family glycosyltransferase
MKNPYNIAVIIPTYNHPAQLIRAVTSLQEQVISDIQVIVVDNSDNDILRSKIETFNRSAKFKVAYLQEPRLGLHYARHAGARYATAGLLVFSDDDATFDPGWLNAYVKAFGEHPEMVAAGGPVRPIWETPPPGWLIEFIGNAKTFPILSLMEPYQKFRLDAKGFFYGVNMAIRRDTLFKMGGFNPELIGSKTVGDGEYGLNCRLREKDYMIGYVPNAIAYHHIPHHRMTVDYLRKWAWHQGGALMYQKFHGNLPSRLRLFAEAVKIVARKSVWWLCMPIIYNRTDRLSLNLQFRASKSWCEINYLWWVHSDSQLRQYLVQKEFLFENNQ